jgi:hypothetical protein
MKRKVEQYLRSKHGPDRAKENPDDGHYDYSKFRRNASVVFS